MEKECTGLSARSQSSQSSRGLLLKLPARMLKAELKAVAREVNMLARNVKLNTMYRLGDHRGPHVFLCKVKQYGQLWCKAMNPALQAAQFGMGEIVKHFGRNQVVLTLEREVLPDGYVSHRTRVLVDGEILTMHGHTWRSMVEVEQ